MKQISFLLISLFLLTGISNSQNVITGTVTDTSGEALPGVSVPAKGTKISTITLADGTYSIEVSAYVNTLIFSYIGMETIEKEITSNIIDVIMYKESEEIEEVVVTAIGISREKIVIGSHIYADTPERSHSRKGEGKVKPLVSYDALSIAYEKISTDDYDRWTEPFLINIISKFRGIKKMICHKFNKFMEIETKINLLITKPY